MAEALVKTKQLSIDQVEIPKVAKNYNDTDATIKSTCTMIL
jgi:hypothetical protein